MLPDPDTCYRAVESRDPRFDGRFFIGVRSTGIYCRPICPAQTPRRGNVTFYASAAAAVAAGFRACRRCRPDAVPGSRQWDARGDLAGRALRLIAEGTADDGGVASLATRLHVSERHLHRVLVAEVGAGPLALARTRRAQTARLLVDETDLPMSDVAFAAGFASVRQFNDSMREEFGATPTRLRAGRRSTPRPEAEPGSLTLRLRHRQPCDSVGLLDFLRARAVPGQEHVSPLDGGGPTTLARFVPAPGGPAFIEATLHADHLVVRLRPRRIDDVPAVVAGMRRTFDLDADPAAVDGVLALDPALAPLVRAAPGVRVPGAADGFELVVRALLGQRISVASATASAARLVDAHGEKADASDGRVTRVFPTPDALADAAMERLPVRLAGAIRAVARGVLDGRLDLSPTADRGEAAASLLAIPGVGPWTVGYVGMRAWADPDAFPSTDLILRRAVDRLGADPDRWRPWRAYAAMHLWRMSA